MTAGKRLPGTPDPMHVWTTSEGLRIAADCYGDLAAPLVLLGHGGGQSRHAWKSTARQLAEAGYYAISFDLLGHGDSDWSPSGDYSMEARVHFIESLVGLLGNRKPVLIGASLSAETFLLATGSGRVDAAALVMADFAPRTLDSGYERNRAFMSAHAGGFASLEEVAEALAGHRGGQPAHRLDGLAKVVRLGSEGRYYWHWDQRLIPWREREHAGRYGHMVAASRGLTIPTLLVHGGKSDVLSAEGAKEFLQLVPHACYVLLPDAGHMMAGDRNDAFGRAAITFLAEVCPPVLQG